MWGNDFPHSESTWPKSREFFSTMFTDVPEAELRKLTCDNAARIFHFSLSCILFRAAAFQRCPLPRRERAKMKVATPETS